MTDTPRPPLGSLPAEPLLQLYHAIGSLTSEVHSLRRELTEKLGPIPEELGKLSKRTAEIEKDLAAIQAKLDEDVMPVVTEVTQWKQRGIGALAMAGMVGSAITVAVTKFLSILSAALTSAGKG